MRVVTRSDDVGNTRGSAPARILTAGGIGTFLEWYDYALFGFMAPQIGAAFFPSDDPTVRLLDTLAVLGVSFVARPFGGAFFGHFGDRLGRRGVLSLIVGLMTLATVGIGVIPSVSSIGLLAPILVIAARLLQGFSAGGEYQGASTFLIEHAHRRRKGFYASIIIAAVALSGAAGAGSAVLTQAVTTEESFYSWGWRIPFIVSVIIGAVGLYIRLSLNETAAFERMAHGGDGVRRMPLVDAFRGYGRVVWVLVWVAAINGVNIYILNAYIPNYLRAVVGMDGTSALAITAVGQITFAASAIGFGILYNRDASRPIFMIGAAGFVVLSIPCFALMNTGVVSLAVVGCCIWGVIQGQVNVGLTLLQVELLPTDVRFSGSAIAYGIAYLVFAGTVAYVATYLVDTTGTYLAAPLYTMGVTVVAGIILVVWRLLDRSKNPQYL